MDKVRQLQRSLYRAAKRHRERRFHALYDRLWRGDVLREAYARLHNFDVGAMVADLRARNLAGDWPVERHLPRRPKPIAAPVVAPSLALPQTEPA